MLEKDIRTIDGYIGAQAPEIQPILQELRNAIREAAPEAEERMSWQMPTFWQQGNLVHFAVHRNHIGFYPAPGAIGAFKSELEGYAQTKGSIHFPIGKPVPYALVRRIVRFRLEENRRRAEEKPKKKR